MPGVHETQRDAADQAGGEGDGGGHEEVPHVRGGVQVRDGQALVGAGVVAGEGGVQPPELRDPGRAVDTRGVAAALDIDKQHRFVFCGGLLHDALLLPQDVHQLVVSLMEECVHHHYHHHYHHLEECVLHQDVVTREDVPGAALPTRGPAAVTQTCRGNTDMSCWSERMKQAVTRID